MFLLDTNVLSELRRRKVGEPRVLAWAEKVDPVTLFLSAITILEVEEGALLLKRRDLRQGRVLEQWLRTFVLPSFSGRILPFDEVVALRCAALHVPATRPERDTLIAATALEHGLTVVTRNIRDFAAMGVPLLNPWEA
jgi:predicted nucleic acid-binding protein